MELTEYMLKQQREMAQAIKDVLEQELVNTTDEIQLADIKTGVDYCNGAIVSCRLAADVLKRKKEEEKAVKKEEEPDTTAEATVEDTAEVTVPEPTPPVPEDKPKSKPRSHHKKDKPPVEAPAVEEDITADLDDLF